MGEGSKIYGKVKAVRPASRENGQYWNPGMSDEVFLQDCIDICQGDLDDTYCAGFSIIPGLRCFFYGEGVKYDRQGKWPAWTFYEKVKRGPTDCDFTNRRKCVETGTYFKVVERRQQQHAAMQTQQYMYQARSQY